MGQGYDWDSQVMAEAIEISRRNLGATGENPSVGAILVAQGSTQPKIVGRGVTARGGRPHAETQAIAQAGELAWGSTLYVTLEPCAHFGKTPPCASAVVKAGIKRVVIAATDPDPRVSGKGIAILKSAGIEIRTGVLEREAEAVLGGFFKRVTAGRPLVRLKLAYSADLKTGVAGKEQTKITGRAANHEIHRLRAEHDGIMIGIGTALSDDPLLTCRIDGETRTPIRIVLDPSLKLPMSARLIQTIQTAPVWLVCDESADPTKIQKMETHGCKVITVPKLEGAYNLVGTMHSLAQLGMSTVLLEGGCTLIRSFLSNHLIDEAIFVTGTHEIGPHGIDGSDIFREIQRTFAPISAHIFEKDVFRTFSRCP
ncbi:bifunctional diaminohydroxyphosphoribosylaminopyrimidine deaminase/5-amino-6-(5-phosphoribosylamino)uracil reductase RibD [Agrobacterium radiobacter]|uniref:bifunctional diaminohydroxyphosphoribosylaminopyrimidine deaminase/5-amino-6-(5-phosphoribosylamino)uracil reductase RibD n=1 Tax=Agrobacterium radiobacter TaxID=362 RepID=UPI003F83C5BC